MGISDGAVVGVIDETVAVGLDVCGTAVSGARVGLGVCGAAVGTAVGATELIVVVSVVGNAVGDLVVGAAVGAVDGVGACVGTAVGAKVVVQMTKPLPVSPSASKEALVPFLTSKFRIKSLLSNLVVVVESHPR